MLPEEVKIKVLFLLQIIKLTICILSIAFCDTFFYCGIQPILNRCPQTYNWKKYAVRKSYNYWIFPFWRRRACTIEGMLLNLFCHISVTTNQFTDMQLKCSGIKKQKGNIPSAKVTHASKKNCVGIVTCMYYLSVLRFVENDTQIVTTRHWRTKRRNSFKIA